MAVMVLVVDALYALNAWDGVRIRAPTSAPKTGTHMRYLGSIRAREDFWRRAGTPRLSGKQARAWCNDVAGSSIGSRGTESQQLRRTATFHADTNIPPARECADIRTGVPVFLSDMGARSRTPSQEL